VRIKFSCAAPAVRHGFQKRGPPASHDWLDGEVDLAELYRSMPIIAKCFTIITVRERVIWK
jgi:hypothetical protein